jgi:hypothetical protein
MFAFVSEPIAVAGNGNIAVDVVAVVVSVDEGS